MTIRFTWRRNYTAFDLCGPVKQVRFPVSTMGGVSQLAMEALLAPRRQH